MNVVPEKPGPKASPNGAASDKRDYGSIALIVVAASLPFALLALSYIGLLMNAPGWTAAFSGLLVLCTIAQAMIAKWQRDTMKEQMAIAKTSADAARDTVEQMRTELRAWLSVDPAPTVIRNLGRPVLYAVTIKNSGKTPARICAMFANALKDPTSDEIAMLIKRGENDAFFNNLRIAVAPNSALNCPYRKDDLIMDVDMLKGTSKLVIAGRIFYYDHTKKLRKTWFCYKYNATSKACECYGGEGGFAEWNGMN